MKIAACIEYLGSNYFGWQRQRDVLSVQECIETALSKVANHTVKVFCAGRTDVGVHASAQVIHFESNSDRTMTSWVKGGNANLPKDIKIIWGKEVVDDFHARFSATFRRYRYIIYQRDVSPAILTDRVTWFPYSLDISKMQNAAQFLLGEQDFSSFRSSQCQSKTAMRNIMQADFYQNGAMLVFEIMGNAFLHHMVRNIIGTLFDIGTGKYSVDWMNELLKLKNRRLASPTAKASGLYLVEVGYPDLFSLPVTPAGPDFIY